MQFHPHRSYKAVVIFALLGGLAGVCAGDSIFFVDGLAVDNLEEGPGGETGTVFHAELPGLPLKRPPRRPGLYIHNTDRKRAVRGRNADHLKKADKHIRKGEWNKARLEIEAALNVDPDNVYLLRRAAALSAAAGKYAAADEYFRRCLEKDSKNAPFMVGWAAVLIRMFRFDEAEKLVERALEIDPEYLPGHFNQTCLRVLKGEDLSQLRKSWEKTRLEELQMVAGWLGGEGPELRAVMGDDGFHSFCGVVLGEGTLAHLDAIRKGIAEVLDDLRQENWLAAAGGLKRLRALGIHHYDLELKRAISLQEAGESIGALKVLAPLRREYPDDPAVWYDTGYVLTKMGKYHYASLAFERALKIAPENPNIRFALACAYAGEERMDDAWKILASLVEHYPKRMTAWMKGEEPYLQRIREDSRYPELMAKAAAR